MCEDSFLDLVVSIPARLQSHTRTSHMEMVFIFLVPSFRQECPNTFLHLQISRLDLPPDPTGELVSERRLLRRATVVREHDSGAEHYDWGRATVPAQTDRGRGWSGLPDGLELSVVPLRVAPVVVTGRCAYLWAGRKCCAW